VDILFALYILIDRGWNKNKGCRPNGIKNISQIKEGKP
jgi:hypothetical protein